MELAFRILNVFTAGARLSGNPLCVFEDGSALSTEQMQALALQFNLSETTFVLAPTRPEATRRVRIFTPTFEMPFAGHPTLGTAYVVRELAQAGAEVQLEMPVGLVAVTSERDRFTLRAAKAPQTRPPQASRAELGAMLGLPEAALARDPLWVDTGSDQLVLPLRSVEDVVRARPDAALLRRHGSSPSRGSSMAYVWARADESTVVARFFFLVHGGVIEDPATGSACANLGGWMIATGQQLPLSLTVRQGGEIGRPSLLGLRVDAEARIFVSGEVIEVGRGTLVL
jgi:trans-2,3-dihydro-3-hydroxyanthranilate isomerase